MKVAVLLATYNRREKTIACLTNLYEQSLPSNCEFEVFLTDDASTDGTQESVKNEFPQINLLHGDGSLFWAGGMRNSWTQAIKNNYDFYLLLNDDTLLKHDALFTLFYTANKSSDKPVI